MRIKVRYANINDCELILSFIKELAVYEKLENEVVATVADLEVSLFHEKEAEVLLLEEDDQAVGFALFFTNYSTFLGKGNIYLEDLYVKEECRGRGYGKCLLAKLAEIALERGCQRLDWACLNWNTSSIEFYKSIQAKPLDEWTTFRMNTEAMENLVKNGQKL